VYTFVKALSHEERLQLAGWLTAHPQIVCDSMTRSLAAFSKYDNTGADFWGKPHPRLVRPTAVSDGRDLMAALTHAPPGGVWPLNGPPSQSLRLIDYEIVVARTTQKAANHLAVFKDARRSTSAMKLDALLRAEDGTPVVGALKVGKEKGFDADPFYALIQALALASQLATPNQRQRLTRCYPSAEWAPGTDVDIAIVVHMTTVPANATVWYCLHRDAELLGRALVKAKLPGIRRIDFIETRWTDGKLLVTRSDPAVLQQRAMPWGC
jgi:hypothetical protein